MPPCGHMMQVVNKDKTCYFNVIFYFEIILLIKSLSTVVPVCPIIGRCVTRSWLCVEGSCKVHVMVSAVLFAGLKGQAAGRAIMLMMH